MGDPSFRLSEVLCVFIDVLKLSKEGCVWFDCGNVFLNFEVEYEKDWSK